MTPIERLLGIMAALRDPDGGCPWDREQDFDTIAPYTIEEAYEVADAIADGDMNNLRDELGDLLFQVVFHARMAEERAAFDFEAVAGAIAEKMIRRHPHVFGDESAEDPDAVLQRWESIKREERASRGEQRRSVLDGIPAALPPLAKAERLGTKVARVGFDWPDAQGALAKVREEVTELQQAVDDGDRAPSDADVLRVPAALTGAHRS